MPVHLRSPILSNPFNLAVGHIYTLIFNTQQLSEMHAGDEEGEEGEEEGEEEEEEGEEGEEEAEEEEEEEEEEESTVTENFGSPRISVRKTNCLKQFCCFNWGQTKHPKRAKSLQGQVQPVQAFFGGPKHKIKYIREILEKCKNTTKYWCKK